ncbi:MAG: hypothetical protein KDC90_16275, partial [Ignavibacteriae bacterium]|nr:hypothetical protein [Ignavibacteriota bacterium]
TSKYLFKTFIISFLLASTNLFAQLNISGFLDLQHQQPLNSKKNIFELNQLEIALQNKVSNNLSIEGVMAFNSEAQKFEIGSGFLDLAIIDHEESGFLNGTFLSNLNITFGQIDIPFGIDYQCFASPDRKTITPPIVIQNSVNCLNRLATDINGGNENYNFNFYLLSGTNNSLAYGARVGLLPYEQLELGCSYLTDISSAQKFTPQVLGTDLKFSNEILELKSELISSKGLYQGEADSLGTNKGFYLQFVHFFEGPLNLPFTAGVRYGNWIRTANFEMDHEVNSISRITLVLGISLIKNVEVKTEYCASNNQALGTENLLYTQLVLTF